MDAPLVVLNEGYMGQPTVIPLPEFFDMYRTCRRMMTLALSKNKEAIASVETVFTTALDQQNPNRGRAIVAAYLLREIFEEEKKAKAIREGKAPEPEAPKAEPATVAAPDIGFTPCGHPTDLECEKCWKGG